jgi:ubiquinone/menaquinone biosynthesis C-methylase UbiE
MVDFKQWQIGDGAAEIYDRIAARYVLGPWAPGLVEAAGVKGGEKILDLACGTGLVTRTAAAKLGPGGHITGLDLNAGMLRVAAAADNPGAGAIDWVEGSALEMALPDGVFDLVLCQQGLQFFPDKAKALAETHRVLRPGGRALFSVWAAAGPYNDAVAAALTACVDTATAGRYLVTRDVPDADTLNALFAGAGFGKIEVERIEMAIRIPDVRSFAVPHLLGTPVAPAVSALGADGQATLAEMIADNVAPYADGDDVVVPDFINRVAATK